MGRGVKPVRDNFLVVTVMSNSLLKRSLLFIPALAFSVPAARSSPRSTNLLNSPKALSRSTDRPICRFSMSPCPLALAKADESFRCSSLGPLSDRAPFAVRAIGESRAKLCAPCIPLIWDNSIWAAISMTSPEDFTSVLKTIRPLVTRSPSLILRVWGSSARISATSIRPFDVRAPEGNRLPRSWSPPEAVICAKGASKSNLLISRFRPALFRSKARDIISKEGVSFPRGPPDNIIEAISMLPFASACSSVLIFPFILQFSFPLMSGSSAK